MRFLVPGVKRVVNSPPTTKWIDPFGLWLVFTAISVVFVLAVVLLGSIDPVRLVGHLRTGGFIESVPAAIFFVTFVLWLIVLLTKKMTPYFMGFAALNLLCALEEAEWGHDPVLGLSLLHESGSDGRDIHNSLASTLKGTLSEQRWADISESAQVKVAIGLIVFSGLYVAIVYLWGLQRSWRQRYSTTTGQRELGPSVTFTIVGLALLCFGFVDTLYEATGWISYPHHWPLEESLEVLASSGLFFAALAELLTVDKRTI